MQLSVIYPLHFVRAFNRRWAARVAREGRVVDRTSRADSYVCGEALHTPWLSGRVVDVWHCPQCSLVRETMAPVKRSEDANQASLLQ